MHRTVQITVSPAQTDGLLQALAAIEEVVGLTVQRGVSVKPPGDVLTVTTLNRGADKVLKAVQTANEQAPVSVVTAELASISDPVHQAAISQDYDQAIWEEMETGLRHQGRITVNFLVLMALGGSIAAVGLVSEPGPQAVAFVASSVIAPGFEPVTKIPLGLVLRRWTVLKMGLSSLVAGYSVLIATAALTFLLLLQLGVTSVPEFASNPEIERLAHPGAKELIFSSCGALAGAIMVAAYRRIVIAGPLIALVIVHAAALIGMGLVCGRFDLAGEGLERLGVDVGLIVGLGSLVFGLKQALLHQRKSLV